MTAANGNCLTPGLERAVAEHELEVLGEQEEEAEHGEEDQRDHAGGDTEPRVEEVAQVQHRRRVAQLPQQEDRDQHGGQAEPQQALGARPAATREPR